MSQNLKLTETTLERINPDEIINFGETGNESLRLHLERYNWASSKPLTGILLDMACGVGYGSEMLAKNCSKLRRVVGIDIDQSAINFARNRYFHEKLSFEVSDICNYNTNNKVDCIISLETIEHVKDPKQLINNFSQILKKGGILIASVPITPSTDGNPHHLTDFSLKSFRALLRNSGFKELEIFIQNQPFQSSAALNNNDPRISNLKSNLLKSYLKKPSLLFKRIASTLVHGLQNKYATIYSVYEG